MEKKVEKVTENIRLGYKKKGKVNIRKRYILELVIKISNQLFIRCVMGEGNERTEVCDVFCECD